MERHTKTHPRSRRARWLGLVAIGVVAAALLGPPSAFAAGTVQVTPAVGLGRITSDPPGIDCPTDCDGNFSVDTVVLTAAGANGYSLPRWGDGCTGGDPAAVQPSCTVDTNPDAATTITAVFDPAAKLDVSPQGPGSVQATFDTATREGVAGNADRSSGPGECHDLAPGDTESNGRAHCILPYFHGDVVTLTATPNPGEPFKGWGRYDCPATSLTCVITMNSDHESVAPLFGATGVLHVLLAGLGTVTSSPGGLAENSTGEPLPCAVHSAQDSDPTCDVTAPMLAPVRLTVIPDDPAATVAWSPTCDVPIGEPTTCIVTMGGTEWISVSIGGAQLRVPPVPPNYKVVLTVKHEGSGTVRGSLVECGSTCSGLYDFGVHETLVASADPGFHFVTWRGACATTTTCSLWVGPTTLLVAVFDADQSTTGQSLSHGESKSKGSGGTQGGKVQLAARIMQFRQVGHRRGRALVVRLFVNKAAGLRVTFQRTRGRASWSFKLRPGPQTVRMPVPRSTRAGLGRLVLTLSDASGSQLTLKRLLRLRR